MVEKTKTFKQNVYSKKLLDPRWQKKRLEILSRDKWACKFCGDKDSTLHVHHKCYKEGYEPWEVENEHLITLCESCHREEERELKEYSALFIQSFRESDFMADDLRELAWGVVNTTITTEKTWVAAEAYSYAFISPTIQKMLIKMVSEYKSSKSGSQKFDDFVKSKYNIQN